MPPLKSGEPILGDIERLVVKMLSRSFYLKLTPLRITFGIALANQLFMRLQFAVFILFCFPHLTWATLRCEEVFSQESKVFVVQPPRSVHRTKIDKSGFNKILKNTIKENSFITHRTLIDYTNQMPDSFLLELSNLDESKTWLDSGSGDFQAIENYKTDSYNELDNYYMSVRNLDPTAETYLTKKALRSIYESSPHSRSKTIGISFTSNRDIPVMENHKTMLGRFLENIPDSEIGSVDLITDIFGPYAYSHQADQVLSKYLRLLTSEGSIYLFLGNPEIDGVSGVVERKGASLTLEEWVRSIPGLRVETSETRAYGKLGVTLIIKKVPGFEVTVPRLELDPMRSAGGTPPFRQYIEK